MDGMEMCSWVPLVLTVLQDSIDRRTQCTQKGHFCCDDRISFENKNKQQFGFGIVTFTSNKPNIRRCLKQISPGFKTAQRFLLHFHIQSFIPGVHSQDRHCVDCGCDGTDWSGAPVGNGAWPMGYGLRKLWHEFDGTSTMELHSGNLLHSYGKWLFIVDFPMNNGDFP